MEPEHQKPSAPTDPEEGEVESLLRREMPRLGRILSSFRVPPQDAEDLIGNVLLQFVRKRSIITNPQGWLRGAVRNECRMYWRGHSRRLTVAVDQGVLDALAGTDEPDPERAILRDGLGRWLATLPRNCRSLLRMRYGLELNDREVAARTGYRPGSVDKVTRRCLQKLSRRIAGAVVHRRVRK